MADISFNIACKELTIVQVSQLNRPFQLLNLVRIYAHHFYEFSRMLMRKNVNNDVSKDSPIQACAAHQRGDHEFPCYSTYLLQIVQTIYNYIYSLVWHSKSSRRGLLYTTCGIPSLSFRNCKAKCSGRGWTTMASRDRLMKPVCHSKATTIVYWIVTRYNIDYAVYKAQSQKNHFPVFFFVWMLKTKKKLNNFY